MPKGAAEYINYTYSGGQNDTSEPEQLKENEAVLIQNAYIRTFGKLEKRNGTVLTGNDTANTAIDGQFAWTTAAGVKYFLRMTGGNLQYLNGSTWTTMDSGFTTSLPTTFVPANGKLYIFNGTDTTHSWDGAAVTLNSCLTDLGSSIPTGKYAIWWKNYMLVWGSVKLSGTTYPARCYVSNIGDPDTWTTASDYFDISKTDGQIGTAIGAIDKFLIFGKERSSYILTGDGIDDWKLTSSINNTNLLEAGVGIASHRSLIQVGDDMWYMGSDGQIRSIRRNEQGTTPLTGIVSGKIRGTLSGMNKAQIAKCAGIVFEGRVYMSFPNGSSTYNNKTVVADTLIALDDPYNPYPWVTYTGWNPAVWAIYTPSSTPQLYYGEASADALTFQAESGSDDNDGVIDFDYKGPMISLLKPEKAKLFRYAKVSGASGGNYNIEISTSIDGVVFSDQGDLNLNAGSVWDTGVWGTATWGYASEIEKKFPIKARSNKLQMRFRNNAANQPVSVYTYTVMIQPKKTE